MGGVLIDLSVSRCKASFMALGFDNVDELIGTSQHNGFFCMLEGGEIDEPEFCRLCREHCSREITDDQAADALSSLLGTVPPEKIAYLRELKDRYPLYVLSNNNPINVRRTFHIFEDCGLPFDDVFTGAFYSHELKVQKPAPGIFRAAIEATGYDPRKSSSLTTRLSMSKAPPLSASIPSITFPAQISVPPSKTSSPS